jgi:hypothetical protein
MSGVGTAAGTSFQARVAARCAVYGLCAMQPPGLALAASARVARVWCERKTPVDDVVVELTDGGFVYVQAKTNVTSSDSPDSALAAALEQFVRQRLEGVPGPPDADTGKRPRLRDVDPKRDRFVLAVGSATGGPIRDELRTTLARARDAETLDLDLTQNERDTLKKSRDHLSRHWNAQASKAPTAAEIDDLLLMIAVDPRDLMDDESGEREAANDLATFALASPDGALGAWAVLCHRFHAAAAKPSGGSNATLWRWLETAGHALSERARNPWLLWPPALHVRLESPLIAPPQNVGFIFTVHSEASRPLRLELVRSLDPPDVRAGNLVHREITTTLPGRFVQRLRKVTGEDAPQTTFTVEAWCREAIECQGRLKVDPCAPVEK